MDKIAESHLKLAKTWLEIISRFMINQKVILYVMENKFDFIKIFLTVLNKGHTAINDEKTCLIFFLKKFKLF